MDTVKVGIIGAGLFGEAHAMAYASLVQARIAGFFDLDGGRAAALAEKYGGQAYPSLDALLADPAIGLVSVVTPEACHLEPVRAAMDAGKAAYIEKPLADSLEDIAAIRDATRGKLAFGGHLLRFEVRYRDIKDHLAECGRLYHMYFRRFRTTNEKRLYRRSHGTLVLQTHDLNLAHWFAGEPFRRVIATEACYRDDGVADFMNILAEFEGGATATLESGYLALSQAGFGADERCSVACEKGTFDLRTPGTDYIRDAPGGARVPFLAYDLAIGDTLYGALRVALEDAVECVRRGEPSVDNTIDDAAEAAIFALAAIRSAAEGRFVTRDEMVGDCRVTP